MQGTVALLALVLSVGIVGVESVSLRNGAKPAKDEMEGFGLSFEIKNYDYFGLTDSWSDPWAEEDDEATDKATKKSSARAGNGKSEDPVGEVIEDLDEFFKPSAALLQLGSTRECWRASDALVQQIIESESSPLTMMDAMRTAIKTAIEGAIACEKEETDKKGATDEKKKEDEKEGKDEKKGKSEKGEKDGKKKESLLALEGKPKKEEEGEKEKTDDKKEEPVHSSLHITFRPGQEEPNLSLLAVSHQTPMLNKPRPSLISTKATVSKKHWSVIVDVTITDRPKNGASDLKKAMKQLKKALSSGQLKDSLRGAIYEVTGNAPDIRRIESHANPIKQWDVDKCENHLTNMVNTFTMHYTRAQVPMALYNECTNFMPKMSFSRDHILDSVDTVRCRKATRAFQKRWKFGKNADSKDFQSMCVEACEAKFGIDAPRCHVTEGKKLKKAPKL